MSNGVGGRGQPMHAAMSTHLPCTMSHGHGSYSENG
jgi:hypothetical protein